MQKVLILGATGMLGSACMRVVTLDPKIDLIGTVRNGGEQLLVFDAGIDSVANLLEANKPNWIINCIGIIKPYINEKDSSSIRNAIKINSEFPILLSNAAEKIGAKVIQIATDCVYSGANGSYIESDLHDATDTYGKTKSLGEVPALNVMHLRA